jgi:hypothetical protein
LEKYGVENPSQFEEFKEKKKQTNRNKLGVDWGLSSKEIKEKSKKTLMKKYGVDNISKIDYIKEKKKQTCFSNYGVEVVSQSQRFRDLYRDKILNFLKEKYNVLDYDDNFYTLHCKECSNNFKIHKKSFQTRKKFNVAFCTICNPIDKHSSGMENDLKDFLSELNINIKQGDRSIISPLEIDIYLPEYKLAFEFNGVYWHSELFKDKNYHFIKTEMCENAGVQLIHIYEDDWLFKQNIVKSKILNLLNKSQQISVERCEIKEIEDNDLIKNFLNENHIQGYIGSKIRIGLFYDNFLISLMIFGNGKTSSMKINNTQTFELLRYCDKLNISVLGGTLKIFNYFIKNYNPTNIITYMDRSWGIDPLYKDIGFKLIHKTRPNYYYVMDGIRKNRLNFRKDELMSEGYESDKTEHEIMMKRNIFRIYDSGDLKFEYVS